MQAYGVVVMYVLYVFLLPAEQQDPILSITTHLLISLVIYLLHLSSSAVPLVVALHTIAGCDT